MKSAYMLRRLVIIFMALTLSVTSVACGSEDRTSQGRDRQQTTAIQNPAVSNNTNQKPIADGDHICRGGPRWCWRIATVRTANRALRL